MTDLRGYLDEIAGSSGTPDTDVVAADVARGRRALRRRQLRQRVAGSVLAVVAVGAVVSVGVTYTGSGTGAPPVAGSVAAPAPVQLVAFTGQQPEGFELDRVPQGWTVQGSDAGSLVLAPVDAADTNPASFVGKIAVFLQDFEPTGLELLAEVPVGGQTGRLVQMEGEDSARTLFVPQPDGLFLTIQVWDGLGWDEDMIASFAAGITVTDEAQKTSG